MTTNSIFPSPKVALTCDALDLIRSLVGRCPELPAPYITLSTCYSTQLGLLVELGEFEMWREALKMSTNDVHLYPVGESASHITATEIVRMDVGGRYVEVSVQLFAAGLPRLEERPTAAVSAVAA